MSANTDTIPVLSGARELAGQNGASANGWWRAFTTTVGLALLPACFGYSHALYDYFFHFGARLRVGMLGWPDEVVWFAVGIAAMGAVAAYIGRPVVAYLFAHEMTHTVATWICLGSVSNLRVSTSGGQVTCSKSNTFIRLAPYIFPLYMLLWIAGWAGASAYGMEWGHLRWLFSFGVGVFLSFHLIYTIWSLRIGQPDLDADGWAFGMILLYLLNLLVVAFAVGVVLKTGAEGGWSMLGGFFEMGWERSERAYRDVIALIRKMVEGRI